jgi:hypothetical protein
MRKKVKCKTCHGKSEEKSEFRSPRSESLCFKGGALIMLGPKSKNFLFVTWCNWRQMLNPQWSLQFLSLAFLSHLSHEFLPLPITLRIGNLFFGKQVFSKSLDWRTTSNVPSCLTNNSMVRRPLNGSSLGESNLSHWLYFFSMMVVRLLKSCFFLQVF